MEYRVRNIIETLKRLPPPTRHGEVINVPVLMETWEVVLHYDKSRKNIPQSLITVRAKLYRDGNREWLEWLYNV